MHPSQRPQHPQHPHQQMPGRTLVDERASGINPSELISSFFSVQPSAELNQSPPSELGESSEESSVYSEVEKLPISSRVLKEFVDIKNGLRMTPGDYGSLCQLFFDNLSTILGVLFATQELIQVGNVSPAYMNEILFGKIVPGLGLTLALGNMYYSWMAIRLTTYWGRQYTAQPYGINTYSAFAFVFNIIFPVFFSVVGREDEDGHITTPDEAFLVAYRVALASNFVQGLISILVGIVGPVLLRYVQPVALLVPVAGLGLAFLGLEQLTNCLAAPIVGYNTILWVFLGWYAGVKVGIGKRRIPEALMVIIVGVVLGWSTGLNKASEVREASSQLNAVWPTFTGGEIFTHFNLTKEYLGIIIPLGISGPINSLMCLVSAKEAGDPYPVRETLIVDGIGTMIASFFGSPFGTVVYIGHPAHKRSGATVGYSLANGFIYLILSLFGFLAIFQALVNPATTGPIVFTIGLLVNEEILNFMSPRHFPAYIIGIFPAIYDWAVNIASRTPISDSVTGDNINLPGSDAWFGVLAWKRGSLLVSMVWTSIIVSVIDRKWRTVAAWSMVGSVMSLTGIIHIPVAGFENLTSPVWEQCDVNTGQCWEFGMQWMFMTAYAMVATTALLINIAKKWDISIQEEIRDTYSYKSSNWFVAAAIDSHPTSSNTGNSQSQMTHTFGDVTVMITDNVGYSDGRFRFAIASEDRRVVIDAKTPEAGQRWLKSLEISDTTGLRSELEQAHQEIIDYESRVEELEDLISMMTVQRQHEAGRPEQRPGQFNQFDRDGPTLSQLNRLQQEQQEQQPQPQIAHQNELHEDQGSQVIDQHMDQHNDGQLDQQINQQMDGQMDQQIDQQMDGQIDEQMDQQIHQQMDQQEHQQMNHQMDQHMDQQINHQMDQQMDRQLHQPMDKQIDQQFGQPYQIFEHEDDNYLRDGNNNDSNSDDSSDDEMHDENSQFGIQQRQQQTRSS